MGLRILLTGGQGFVGQHFKARLQDRIPGYVLLEDPMDIRDRAAVERFVRNEKPDACLHLDGTLILAESFEAYAPEASFVFVSTAEIYGASFRSGAPLDESAVIAPVNAYASSKAAADLAVGNLSREGLHGLRLRSFTQAGTGQDGGSLLPFLAAQVARIETGQQPPVLTVGDPDTGFDVTDVRDACDAYVSALALPQPLPDGTALNICSGVTRTVGSIARDLLDVAGVAASIVVDPAIMSPTGLPSMRGNPDAARAALNWSPRIAWTETLLTVLNDWRYRITL
ncbi:NAD-dependent epimerase/dehydratase family protein [Gluconobacter kanchanaburiensis]|uniref:GDP-6-deoxy-D-lyxo-4-hexulose reductase n=1 Tax=Gluconobacter kanchanaburiensis NBRC 103587 TaxID=1307948 RepID=A0A511B7C0_9PROT|nr:GDP-mannose 4,6-dehydratase [Gluconobacter kanchanaburiensis]MBF0862366.1 NAD-dependent epimerase/dehydratase family protein [Gluconobacter kanchanaburiensis]GBR68791.1 oxidoreductase [Gluconobacter kanchanaburiensis NBRC 103587]GEK96355.1 GDP-6-deoxy-D-lyxo-4-hexulose reductase [Gluconobacter kanchanaburiensis NBRC 103587]